jgi:hypothetical protein
MGNKQAMAEEKLAEKANRDGDWGIMSDEKSTVK